MCCEPALQEEVLSSSTFNLTVTETTDSVSKGLSRAQSRLDNVGQWLPNWFFMLPLVCAGDVLKPCPERLHKTQTKVVVPLLEDSLRIYLHPVRKMERVPPQSSNPASRNLREGISRALQFSSTAALTQPLPGESQTHLLSLVCTKTCVESLFPPGNTDPLVPPTPVLTAVGNTPGSSPEPSSVPKICWMAMCKEDSNSLASLGQCISLFCFIIINLKLIHPSFKYT